MILNKKVALITGATGVIGSCLAEHFFRAGYKLVLTGRSKDKLNDLKKKLKEDVLIYPADISNYKEIKKILEFVEKEAGRLDTIIPAAGIYGEIGTLEQCDPEKWEDAFRVNVFGAMGVIKYALPLLKKSSSAGIILFAGGGEGSLPNFSAYTSSKGAVIRLGESLAQELKGDNIKVNIIYPGVINSGFVRNIISVGPERAGEKAYNDAWNQINGKIETSTPDKVGELCIFLASENSNGLTGKIFAARYDDLNKIEMHKDDIMNTDIYSIRRIKPKHLGYDW